MLLGCCNVETQRRKHVPDARVDGGPLSVLGTAEGPRLTQRMSPWSAAGQAAPLQRE